MKVTTISMPLIAAALGCAPPKANRSTTVPSRIDRAMSFAKAELKIERMRKQETPDWQAIKEQYEVATHVVREIDGLRGTGYDAEIRKALEKCARGEEPKVNQQVLAKGLQHVAVLAMMRELDAIAKTDPTRRLSATVPAAAYFEGIRPTFSRRDRDFFGGESTLEGAALQALERLMLAVAAGTGDILTARRELEDAVARTYALSVLYEVEGIEKLRDRDRAACDVKRKEAEIFYRIIRPRVRRRDPKADEAISAMLAGSYGAVSSKVVEEALKKGLPGVPLR